MQERITLTQEMIEACKTDRGGFTSDTIEAFGLTFPLKKGWAKRLVGQPIFTADYDVAFAGREKFTRERVEKENLLREILQELRVVNMNLVELILRQNR